MCEKGREAEILVHEITRVGSSKPSAYAEVHRKSPTRQGSAWGWACGTSKPLCARCVRRCFLVFFSCFFFCFCFRPVVRRGTLAADSGSVRSVGKLCTLWPFSVCHVPVRSFLVDVSLVLVSLTVHTLAAPEVRRSGGGHGGNSQEEERG